MAAFSSTKLSAAVGRYVLHGEIASGGMATVHLGRLQGAGGFARSVAIKRLHPQFAKDPDFVSMFVDEARLAARIAHPNVVPTLDVVSQGDELLLVMEYVRGASLSRLLRALAQKGERAPPRIVASILSGVLHGLHAAHEAKGETGRPLDIVHRDVSPQNVLVGTDGVARVLDFGVAKATGRWQSTRKGQLKGKIAYMAPEQVSTGTVTRKTDLYAATVVLWESLTGRRLFRAENEAKLISLVLGGVVQAPSELVEGLAPGFDRIVHRGLQRDPWKRFATGREMASELEAVVGMAPATEVGEWVERVAADELRERANRIDEIERSSPSTLSSQNRPSAVSAGPIGDYSSGANRRAEVSLPAGPGVRAPAFAREHASQVSHLAMVHTDPRARLARRKWVAIAAAAAALCAIAACVVALRASHTGHLSASPGPASAPATAATPGAATGTSTWIAIPPPSPPATATPIPAATAAPQVPPTPPRVRRPAGTARQSSAAGPSDCVPPYTTDAKGHVHFKPACVN
jgi:serine/threonine protein kinase